MCAPHIPREVAALIAALQLKGATTEGLLELTAQEWESLLKFCEPAHLTLPLAKVPGSGFPVWVTERLKQNVIDNAARFERVKATYREAAIALDQAGIDHILLKGFTQFPDYIQEARLRMQSDLDLYCPKELREQAKEVLISIGYHAEQTLDYSRADHLPAMIRPGNWQWRGNAFDPEMPLAVEVHFCLWNEDIYGFPVADLEHFWERRIKRSLEDLMFPDLHPIDHLGYMALHILRGLLAGEWIIHHVHEVATFLHNHAKDDTFWKSWMETHSKSFRDLQCIAFFHARSWFCCDVHSDIQTAITAMQPSYRAWLARFAGSAMEGMFRKNKDRVWLHATLVESKRKKLALIVKTILPVRISRLPSMDAPSVRITNRQLKQSGTSNKYVLYMSYLLNRFITHSLIIPALLLRGVPLWFSLHPFRKQLNQ
jgi:Uncharacterised nucleotidyltransferase